MSSVHRIVLFVILCVVFSSAIKLGIPTYTFECPAGTGLRARRDYSNTP